MNYMNPVSIDPYAGAPANAAYSTVSSPWELQARMQNRDTASALYGQQLQQGQLDLNEAQRKDLNSQFEADQMAKLRENPEYISALTRQKMNDILAQGAKSGNEYISTINSLKDQLLSPAMNAVSPDTKMTPAEQAQYDAQQQSMYDAGRRQLAALGLDRDLPTTFNEAAPQIMANANRYQYSPQYLQQSGLNNAKQQGALDRAQMQAEMQAQIQAMKYQQALETMTMRQQFAVPQSIEQALVMGKITPQQAQQLWGMKPQFNPQIQGDLAGAKDPTYQIKELLANNPELRAALLGNSTQQQPQIPQPQKQQQSNTVAPPVGHVMNGYRFKGGDPKQQSNWEKIK